MKDMDLLARALVLLVLFVVVGCIGYSVLAWIWKGVSHLWMMMGSRKAIRKFCPAHLQKIEEERARRSLAQNPE